jgi:L-seryl-tRNA(Ser) seleniumtransferase
MRLKAITCEKLWETPSEGAGKLDRQALVWYFCRLFGQPDVFGRIRAFCDLLPIVKSLNGRFMDNALLRCLPSVSQLVEHPDLSPHLQGEARPWLLRLVQMEIDGHRERLLRKSADQAPDRDVIAQQIVQKVLARRDALLQPAMRRVINATGVVVHTNIGRSLYSKHAAEAIHEAALCNLDLEMDLDSGKRGHRGRKVEFKAALLAGAQDALIVNNNAAALWLAVRATAGAGRVILSRGEVVAIGGSFKLHEILAETGCELCEVGTTNRTSLKDYAQALTPGAVVLKVHRSNFSVSGFTEDVTPAELAELCREKGHVLIYDAGSGQLQDMARFKLPGGETLADDVGCGADLITCSGDKLLGGGQAGFVLGRSDLIDRLRQHPMRRALRVDKTTLAAVDAVLISYLQQAQLTEIPTLEMLDRDDATLERMAAQLEQALRADLPAGWTMTVRESRASVGGGSHADVQIDSRILNLGGPQTDLETCHNRLRRGTPSVLSRISQQGLAFDMRALPTAEMPLLIDAVRAVWSTMAATGKGRS